MTTDEQLARGWFKEGVETFLKDKHAATFNTPDYYYASGYLRAKQEARIAALTTQEEIRKQLESETFEEYDWFYKLKFICRVLGNDGNAPKEDWKTAYGYEEAKSRSPALKK